MKKLLFIAIIIVASFSTFAQDVDVPEPEFVNSYWILTSDTTTSLLPKEYGTVGPHMNKVKKWSKVVGKVADVAGTVGIVGIGVSGSAKGVLSGVKTVTTATSVGTAATTVSALAGSNGMDIIFSGGKSEYQVDSYESNLRLIVRVESNELDPMDCYRIVRFNNSKKERRIQWMEFEPDLLGTEDTAKKGYVNFSAQKYGEKSYLITIPASELGSGEYGIVSLNNATPNMIPVGTFSIIGND